MKKKRNMDRFLQQVENLVTAASLTAEELRESGFGYMAARLEKALSDLALDTPTLSAPQSSPSSEVV